MSAKPCRGCGKMVVFAKDPDGKWQVLDNVSPTWEQVGVKDGVARVIRSKALVSHFATCPDANKFSASNREPVAAAESQTPFTMAPERHFSEPKEVS